METYKFVMLAVLLALVCPSGIAFLWILWKDCQEAKRRRAAVQDEQKK